MRNVSKPMVFTALFTALTALGAFIQIPIPPYPVPMTLQTAFLFLAGLLLQKREAFFSQVTYVVLGLIGIPIFTKGGGTGYVFDPTFGYLLGFIVLAPALRMLAERTLYAGKRRTFAVGSVLLITLLQFIGVGYMCLVATVYTKVPISFSRALYLVAIFLPLDILKLTFSTTLALQLRKRLPHVFK